MEILKLAEGDPEADLIEGEEVPEAEVEALLNLENVPEVDTDFETFKLTEADSEAETELVVVPEVETDFETITVLLATT